jgi:hypothetical protein
VDFSAKYQPEPNSGCWLWLGHTNGGYGRLKITGKSVYAHRAVYEQVVGPIPAGLDLDHKCRTRSCVNPDHLEPVTRQVNCQRGVLGETSRKRQLAKTHCPSGHEYAGKSLRMSVYGYRYCGECARLREQRKRDFLKLKKELA